MMMKSMKLKRQKEQKDQQHVQEEEQEEEQEVPKDTKLQQEQDAAIMETINNGNDKQQQQQQQQQQVEDACLNPTTIPEVVIGLDINTAAATNHQLTNESIYEFYVEQLLPAIQASLPILLGRLSHDLYATLQVGARRVLYFLLPWLDPNSSSYYYYSYDGPAALEWSTNVASRLASNMTLLWEQVVLIMASSSNNNNATSYSNVSNNLSSSSSSTTTTTNSFQDFMLRNFDSNHDGHISPAELVNMTEHFIAKLLQQATTTMPLGGVGVGGSSAFRRPLPPTFWAWFSREWPLMDWKVGLFVWRSCGGLLLVISILTIIPGRLHGISGRLLRWPILALTYFLISVELMVYIVIRVFIRIAELLIANPKHRQLRRACRQATSYSEWYHYAQQLDKSQRRCHNNNNNNNGAGGNGNAGNDTSSYRYNWPLIQELMNDMKRARRDHDSLLALAVLQQCTRKNVGGIMSEELFSYTNTGEPKHALVQEFVHEVVTTLHYVTDKAVELINHNNHNTNTNHKKESNDSNNNDNDNDKDKDKDEQEETEKEKVGTEKKDESGGNSHNNNNNNKNSNRELYPEKQGQQPLEAEQQQQQSYEERLQRKVKTEKDKIWRSVVTWATRTFQDNSNNNNNNNNTNDEEDGDDDDEQDARTKRMSSSSSSSMMMMAEEVFGHHNIRTITTLSTPTTATTTADATDTRSPTTTTTTTTTPASPTGDDGDQTTRNFPAFHRETVLTLLKRARAAYGRTALCLSGGAMMGNYHWGHVKALLEEGLLPHIISGTSAGSVVGAIFCTRTDEELKRDLVPEVLVEKLVCFSRPWMDRIKSVVKNGHMFDVNEWLTLIKWFTCGDLTFEEAYRKTGRVFCITLSATTKKSPPVLLNYISAPNVTIASAVVASAAVPGFVPPVSLQYKDANGVVKSRGKNVETYFDGSIEQDIPTSGLAEMLNVQFFVACQCNPHIVPFFYNSKGGVGRPTRWSSGEQEYCWRGGFLLAALEMYLKNDMKAKFVFLNDLEAAVGFTSTMMTQEFGGSTTIVPEVSFFDYFKLFSDPSLADLKRYLQVGSVAVYPHCAMIKLHYSIADALDECLSKLENRSTRPRVKALSHDGGSGGVINTPPPPTLNSNGKANSAASLDHHQFEHHHHHHGKNKNDIDPQSSSETSVMSEEDEYERNWVYDISPRH